MSLQSVHTTGINWESIAVIVTAVLTIVGAFTGWIGNKIRNAIENQTSMLEAKLETKEKVASIDRRLMHVEDRMRYRDKGRRGV